MANPEDGEREPSQSGADAMPIDAAFKRFENEARFTSECVVPLLQRLGYTVLHNHGTQEMGLDLIVSELDRMGDVRYHGIQVKHTASISLSDATGLVQDCKQAFANTFEHPITGDKKRISMFYAINSGGISDTAKTHFFNALSVDHGGCIRLIDGRSLVALDKFAAFNQQQSVGSVLSGLRLEMGYNELIISHVYPKIAAGASATEPAEIVPVDRLRVGASSAYLNAPLASEALTLNVWEYVHVATIYNSYLGQLVIKRSQPRLFSSLVRLGEQEHNLRESIIRNIKALFSKLGPLTEQSI